MVCFRLLNGSISIIIIGSIYRKWRSLENLLELSLPFAHIHKVLLL